MTNQEKAINLWYLFLTYKPEIYIYNPSIHSPLSSDCIGMFQFFQKSIFDPNTCTLPKSPNNGFRWCPLGKLSHLRLEQLHGTQYVAQDSLNSSILWALHTVETPIKGYNTEVNGIRGIIKSKGAGTVVLDLEDDIGKLWNIIIKMSTTYLELPISSSSLKNGHGSEEKTKFEGQGPTSRWWTNTPSLCGTTLNPKVPPVPILGDLSQRYP